MEKNRLCFQANKWVSVEIASIAIIDEFTTEHELTIYLIFS
jgi:hypothetical protein